MIKPRVDLITILTDDVPSMVRFYRDVMGFAIQTEMGDYVELESPGVRFSICSRAIMEQATGYPDFHTKRAGQSFELAFPVDSPEAVDAAYAEIVAQGAIPIKEPADMPWHQRAAFFADPEGNVHELFANLPG